MKRLGLVLLAAAIAVSFAGQAIAAPKKKQQEPVVPTLSDAQAKALVTNAVTTLSGKAWTIYLAGLGAKKSRIDTDELTFTEIGMVSKNLTARGFGGSNYSMHAQPDESVVWETVQRKEDDSVALWRGELRGGELYGTLSIHPMNAAVESYSFSTSMPAVTPVAEPVKAEPKKK